MYKIIRISLLMLIFIFSIKANSFCDHMGQSETPKVTYSLGALGMIIPKYEGASKYRFLPVPNFKIQCFRHIIISPYRGLSINMKSLHQTVSVNFGVRYKFWFRSDRSKRYNGFNDLKPYGEGYSEIKLKYDPLVFSLGIYHSIVNFDIGGFLRIGINYLIKCNKNTVFFVGPTTKISNKSQMATIYRVSETQGIKSNMPEYDVVSGIEDLRLNFGIHHKFNKKWNGHAMFSVKRLANIAANSPLIENRIQYFSNISINYTF